jgi:hypothetical protein
VCTFTPSAAHHAGRLRPLRSQAAIRRAHSTAFFDRSIATLLAPERASVSDPLSEREGVVGGRLPSNAIDYALKRWAALARYLDDGRYPIDNNGIENAIRPIALGRKNWLFAGSERAGERAAAIMGLLATAKANGHEPHAWLSDVLTRLPTTKDRDIGTLLPHTWAPAR